MAVECLSGWSKFMESTLISFWPSISLRSEIYWISSDLQSHKVVVVCLREGKIAVLPHHDAVGLDNQGSGIGFHQVLDHCYVQM
jgi:hypothetical protein